MLPLQFKHIPFVETAIAVLIICLPFSNSTMLINGIQTAKSFNFFYSVLGLMMLGSIAVLFHKRKLQLRITSIDMLLLLLVVWITINKYLIHDIYCLSLNYYELLGLSVLYVIIRSINKRYVLLFLISICISGAAQAIYGNLQLWGYFPSHHGLFKMTGSFFNPGPYAGYLCAVLPVAVGIYWCFESFRFQISGSKFQVSSLTTLRSVDLRFRLAQLGTCNLQPLIIKYVALFTIITILLVLPAARSRAAWLGAIAGVAYLIWHKFDIIARLKHSNTQTFKLIKRTRTISNKFILTILAVFILAGGISLYLYKKDSANGRLLIWKVTTNIIKDYPLFGVGQGMFVAHYMNYQSEYFKAHPGSKYEQVADNNSYVFNEFLKVFVENGVFALLVMLVLIGVLFFKREHEKGLNVQVFECLNVSETLNSEATNNQTNKWRSPQTIFKASILATIVFSCFGYPSEILPTKIILIVLLASATSLRSNSEVSNIQTVQPSNNKNFKQLSFIRLTTLFFIALAMVCIPRLTKLKTAYVTWNDANNLYAYSLYKLCLEDYKKAYPMLKNNGNFLLYYGKALSIAEKHYKAIIILEQSENYLQNIITYTALGDSYQKLGENHRTEKAYAKAHYMSPERFYAQYLLVKYYERVGEMKKAAELAQKLIDKTVKVKSIAVDEMKEELQDFIESNVYFYN
ncbi:MAG: O-antigen ligase family protein [Bacteroidales bacterium]|nr:O-antigen ligase family protein [Bacteroidales bacterium]